jgi:hypothetical protein
LRSIFSKIDIVAVIKAGKEITRYRLYQDFSRQRQAKLLTVWEENDPFFTQQGAETFLREG